MSKQENPVGALLFRFDASSCIGFGHAFRCGALIEYLYLNFTVHQLKCVIITKYLPTFLQLKFVMMGAEIEFLASSLNMDDELFTISSIKEQYQSRALVLDGYQFDRKYRNKLAETTLKIVNFDDTNKEEELFCDLVINALPDAKSLGYQYTATAAKHLLGLPYSIIRQEFLLSKSIRFSERKLLLINFGNSDVAGITLPILQKLSQSRLLVSPENVVVISGGGDMNYSDVNLFCSQLGYRHIHNCTNMAELLNQTRMAICAPGAIIYELAYCRVPSVFLSVAENQLLSARAHQESGWSYVFNGLEEQGLLLAVQQSELLWGDDDKLALMSDIAGEKVDGKGVKRIIREVITLIN